MCGNALTLGCSECGEKYETARGFATLYTWGWRLSVLRRTLRLCQWMKASRERPLWCRALERQLMRRMYE